MIGQYSNDEFEQMLSKAFMCHSRNYETKIASIRVGNTYNYYKQHDDGSWTNYDCKTKY
jgi:hypothetical protein